MGLLVSSLLFFTSASGPTPFDCGCRLEEAKAEQKGDAKADGEAAESGDEEAKRTVDYGVYSDLRKVCRDSCDLL